MQNLTTDEKLHLLSVAINALGKLYQDIANSPAFTCISNHSNIKAAKKTKSGS